MQQPYYSGLKAVHKYEPQHNPAICPFTVPKVLAVIPKCSWLTIFSYLIQLANLHFHINFKDFIGVSQKK
jgi:hypothetical protein